MTITAHIQSTSIDARGTRTVVARLRSGPRDEPLYPSDVEHIHKRLDNHQHRVVVQHCEWTKTETGPAITVRFTSNHLHTATLVNLIHDEAKAWI